MSNRTFRWTIILLSMKVERATRPTVREELLRTGTNSHTAATLALSVWRGHTGRRYVVVVQPLDTPELVVGHAAVVLAVTRDRQARAAIVAVRACECGDPGFLGWLAACARRGARELHVHRLADTETERASIAADLGGPIRRSTIDLVADLSEEAP